MMIESYTIKELEEMSDQTFEESISEYVESCIRNGYTNVEDCARYFMKENNIDKSEWYNIIIAIDKEFNNY